MRCWTGWAALGAVVVVVPFAVAWAHSESEKVSASAAEVESGLRIYVADSGVTVNPGTCDDQDEKRPGLGEELNVWVCTVHYPATVLTPEMDRRWVVTASEGGIVYDAAPEG